MCLVLCRPLQSCLSTEPTRGLCPPRPVVWSTQRVVSPLRSEIASRTRCGILRPVRIPMPSVRTESYLCVATAVMPEESPPHIYFHCPSRPCTSLWLGLQHTFMCCLLSFIICILWGGGVSGCTRILLSIGLVLARLRQGNSSGMFRVCGVLRS
jgi:hypothetical protein